MKIEEFVEKFAAEFDDTPAESFTADTNYKDLEEWGSLTALSIISMIDEEYDKNCYYLFNFTISQDIY